MKEHLEKKNNTIEPIDLSELLKGFELKWVVLSSDNKKVIAHGNSLEEIKDFIELGIVMKVPDFKNLFIP